MYTYFRIYNPGFNKFLDISDVLGWQNDFCDCVWRYFDSPFGRCHGSFIHGL